MLSTIVLILTYIAQCFVFKKMGRQWWEGLIPIYNIYVEFEVLYGNGIKFLLLLIPFYNIYVAIKLQVDLAHAFNQTTPFALGLIFLSPVFLCIIAFSNSIQFGDGSNEVNAKEDIKEIFK